MPDRLKENRKARSLSQDHMAEQLGISRQAYSHYETGRNEPDGTALLKIAEIFDCSVDYLLGRINTPWPIVNHIPEELEDFIEEFINAPNAKQLKIMKIWDVIK
ncbi:helix-turn-helix domain-containing protein [Caldalkalibacillus salinus]|uniref:helix-turn-helix domain-containing protein n=1 Tax=Caldalkalibacillus salinus TaxID=2803787 RepID=UPI00192476E6|nr:helix-turn-helix transcriptional regulator [Caldalkalibacillus salinus]